MKITKALTPHCFECGVVTKHNHWGRGPFKHIKPISVRQCVNKECKFYNNVMLWYPFRGWLHFNVNWKEKE